eukprot:6463430-Amphidinium_carterae.2
MDMIEAPPLPQISEAHRAAAAAATTIAELVLVSHLSNKSFTPQARRAKILARFQKTEDEEKVFHAKIREGIMKPIRDAAVAAVSA